MASTSNLGGGFNAATFRSAIKNVMKMGAPETVAERPTFKWRTNRTFQKTDGSGNPWDFGTTPSSTTTHPDVQIDCAVEFISRTTIAGGTAIGHFDNPRVILTVLDVDYPSIVGAEIVTLGGNSYQIDFVAPPVGLFDVTVYSIHASALDES